jgi:hypothetical protein
MRTSGIRGVLFAGVAMLALMKCGSDEDAAPVERSEAGCGTTDFSICGYAFDDLTDELNRPAYTSPFSSALMRWADDERCDQGGFGARGLCEDGKEFLFFRFGETTEVRYYDDERPIAVVLLGAESTCGDPCPRESFYGALEDVRCDAPKIGGLCGTIGNVEASDLPFAAGAPLNACVECAP